jgi:hypothetical protein
MNSEQYTDLCRVMANHITPTQSTRSQYAHLLYLPRTLQEPIVGTFLSLPPGQKILKFDFASMVLIAPIMSTSMDRRLAILKARETLLSLTLPTSSIVERMSIALLSLFINGLMVHILRIKTNGGSQVSSVMYIWNVSQVKCASKMCSSRQNWIRSIETQSCALN